MFKAGDRVSESGSWYCGTVLRVDGEWVKYQLDRYNSGSSAAKADRTEYQHQRWLRHTDYYNECWNAWKMQEDGIPSVAPEWKGK